MPRVSLFAAVIVVSAVLQWPVRAQIPPEGGTPAYLADLSARRARIMSALGPDTVLVLWSAPSRLYSADIDYPYRQDSNLFYFTGLTAEAAKLVLMPGAAAREFLFVRQSDPFRELWRGHDLTPAEVTASTGIPAVVAATDDQAFQSFIDAVLSGRDLPPSTGGPASVAPAGSVQTPRTKLAIAEPLPADFEATAAPGEGGTIVRWARAMRARYPSIEVVSVAPVVQRQRQVKTPYEQRVLTRSAAISAAAHVEGMRATRPGRWEYELKAAVEYQFLKNGSLSWGYPSIVGSGPNATSLHYLSGTRQMRDGDMVLVDAAGSYQGMTADITRSYPVNGRFTSAQRAIYELVLKAQEAGIAAARPGVRAEAVTNAIRGVFRAGLRDLGLVQAAAGAQLETEVDLWFPHLPIHGIGVDVHDPLGDLVPGAAFVIEPGLYIRSDAFGRSRPVPLPQGLADQLAPALARYRDIGIRIEDSFIMTTAGPVMISAAAPRRIADLERTVGKGR